MSRQFFLLFLIFLSANLASGSKFFKQSVITIDNLNSFYYTSVLKFNKLIRAEGSNPISQLICQNGNANETLCSMYEYEDAECKNLNFKKTNKPNWVCQFSNAQLTNSNVIVYSTQVYCEDSKELTEKYIKNSCSLKYSLRKSSDYKKADKETGTDDSGLTKADIIGLTLLGIFFAGFIFGHIFFFFCIPNRYCFTECNREQKWLCYKKALSDHCCNSLNI